MEETVFFENGNVKVTNARFIVADQTYAMAAVNSVKVSSIDITPSNTMPGILVAVGAIWFVSSIAASSEFSSYFWSVAILAVGIFWLRSIKKTLEYKIILTTSSGETSALKSTNDQDIRPVEKGTPRSHRLPWLSSLTLRSERPVRKAQQALQFTLATVDD